MQYAKLKNDILAARERRDEELQKLLATLAGGSIIQLALNVPGCDKRPAGSEALFGWGQEQLNNAVAPSLELFDVDALGPWVLYASPGDPVDVKMKCCRIEDYRDFARLLDFDVYAADGNGVRSAAPWLAAAFLSGVRRTGAGMYPYPPPYPQSGERAL